MSAKCQRARRRRRPRARARARGACRASGESARTARKAHTDRKRRAGRITGARTGVRCGGVDGKSACNVEGRGGALACFISSQLRLIFTRKVVSHTTENVQPMADSKNQQRRSGRNWWDLFAKKFPVFREPFPKRFPFIRRRVLAPTRCSGPPNRVLSVAPAARAVEPLPVPPSYRTPTVRAPAAHRVRAETLPARSTRTRAPPESPAPLTPSWWQSRAWRRARRRRPGPPRRPR